MFFLLGNKNIINKIITHAKATHLTMPVKYNKFTIVGLLAISYIFAIDALALPKYAPITILLTYCPIIETKKDGKIKDIHHIDNPVSRTLRKHNDQDDRLKAIIIARFIIVNILKLLKNRKKLKIDSAIIITLENRKYNQNSFLSEMPL